MGEPLARMDVAGEGVLAHAAQRLDRALQSLEAALGHGPSGASNAAAQGVERETLRWRSRELEVAATEASRTLGRAMAEMRRALQDDELGTQDPQTSLFDAGLLEEDLPDGARFNSPLESEPGLADEQDETEAAGPAAEKEPAE